MLARPTLIVFTVQVESQFDCDEDTYQDGLWAALLQRRGVRESEPHTYTGLLLVPHAKPEISEGSARGNVEPETFRRVGYFETALKDGDRSGREPFGFGITGHPMQFTLV